MIKEKIAGYSRGLSFLMKTKFSRKFNKDKKGLISVLSLSKRLTTYLGQEIETTDGQKIFAYSIKDDKGCLLRVTYSNDYGAVYNLPNSKIELYKKVNDEYILVSRFSPTADMILPGMNHYFGNMPKSIGGDFEPQLALTSLINAYDANKEFIEKRIKKSPRFIWERLTENFPAIENLKYLDRFTDFITSEDLITLEEKLNEIASASDYKGIKIDRGEKLVRELSGKYEKIRQEKEKEEHEAEKKEQEQLAKNNREEYEMRVKKEQARAAAETRQKLERIVIHRGPSSAPTTGIAGYRRDINLNVKSTWEANYARILMYQKLEFDYESETFEMDVPQHMQKCLGGKKRVSYTPDFHIKGTNKFVEVKGDWSNYNGKEALAKILLLNMLHPEIDLEVVDVPGYRKLEKNFKEIIDHAPGMCGWETGSRTSGKNLATHPKDFGSLEDNVNN